MGILCRIIYPEKVDNDKILKHPEFEEELKSVLEESGYKSKFISLFRQRLKHLDERWKNCILKKDWFEILKGTNDIYSMKFKGQKNIRILFKFTGYEGREIALLLCTFEEKNSKNKSKDSYNKAIEVANKRLKEIEDLFKRGL